MDKQLVKAEARRLAAGFMGEGYVPRALHHYTDKNGVLIYSRMRLYHPEKKEKLIRPFYERDGHYILGEPKFDGKKPLYQLPLIKDAETVFWVEGEPKVDALIKLGLVATTSGGATSHDSVDLEPCRGKSVVIWPDADDSGKTHAKAVKTLLEKLDCDVALIVLISSIYLLREM